MNYPVKFLQKQGRDEHKLNTIRGSVHFSLLPYLISTIKSS
jgi:hypothetical protein